MTGFRTFFLFSLTGLLITGCSTKPTAPAVGEINMDSIAVDTTMQRKLETSYEFQQDLMAGQIRYEVKSASYLKNFEPVKHFVVVRISADANDTLYNQSEPSHVVAAALINNGTEIKARWKKAAGDTAESVFSLRAKPH